MPDGFLYTHRRRYPSNVNSVLMGIKSLMLIALLPAQFAETPNSRWLIQDEAGVTAAAKRENGSARSNCSQPSKCGLDDTLNPHGLVLANSLQFHWGNCLRVGRRAYHRGGCGSRRDL